MSSVFHSGLHALADPVVGPSAVSDGRLVPLVASPQDEAPGAGQARPGQQLHRLEAVRRQEGISRRTIARRLGIGLREVQAQEQGSSDLPLSMLYRWKEILNVPISELLEEDAGEVSSPVMFRGKLLRVMRTAVTILERTRNTATHRMAQFMVEQLIEIMPELKDTTSWPSVGKRRSRRELGRAARLRLPADVMRDLDES
jgi:transcriptional regulator with XRE-family HTH domain